MLAWLGSMARLLTFRNLNRSCLNAYTQAPYQNQKLWREVLGLLHVFSTDASKIQSEIVGAVVSALFQFVRKLV